jgi:hypothetical protein
MLAPTPVRAASSRPCSSRQPQASIEQCTRQRPALRALRAAADKEAAPSVAAAAPTSTTTTTTAAPARRPPPPFQQQQQQQQQQQLLSMAAAAAPASALLGLALALAAAGPAAAAAADPLPAAAADLASSAAAPLFTLSEGEDFFANVARYGRYFVTVMLGTGYMMAKPVVGLVKKGPLTAVLTVGGGLLAVYGVKFTLDAMLGLSDAGGLAYDPDLVVTRALMRQG